MVGYIPKSLEHALSIREETGALPISGGTDLMVRYRISPGVSPVFPKPLLYLLNLEELKGIREEGEFLSIGAGTSLAEIAHNRLIPQILREAVSQMAAPALRNLGTLAGNVGNASPAGDGLCVLYALDAVIEVSSVTGSELIPVEQFITGPGKTLLDDTQLITALSIPKSGNFTHFYKKVGTRRANALSKLSFAGLYAVSGGEITNFRAAIGAVAPTVVRSAEIEASLIGMDITAFREKRDGVKDSYSALINPIDDQRSTKLYRKETALNLLSAFLDRIEEELVSCLKFY